MVSQVQGQIHQHPNYPQRRRVHPPGHRHQLLFVVCGWVYLPILDQAEKLFVVVEVQLRYERCDGLRYVADLILQKSWTLPSTFK